MNRSQALLDVERGDETTLEELLEAVRNPDGEKDFEVKEVMPVPGFVVKTRDEAEGKVFINVCGCTDVPAPGDWQDGKVPKEVVAALKSSSTSEDALRFPLSASAARTGSDKRGEPCVIYDCLFNLDILLAAKKHKKLKIFLVGLAIEWIAHKNGVKLSAEYKLPKMHYKGKEIESHRVKVQKGPLVQELRDVCAARVAVQELRDVCAVLAQEKQAPLVQLHYAMRYENRPVDTVVVEFDLPEGAAKVKPEVWLSGFRLNVDLPGVAERCVVELPLAVDAYQAHIVMHATPPRMCVTLPFKPISSILDELKAEDNRRGAPPLESEQGLHFETVALKCKE